ncbi:hemolysin type calcium-binding protein [Shimia isoporae]|uniref:Hemolysin type calcium-binding protein n=1 Tax=Shimia isoporae TaxID=647720 RepID=A0A4R1NNU8_9RHOB|nr:calcium-binding protein [Shimia isoporae]TCL09885.1 hemolysin type calcium-binding protein [Shimia isoporae]
MSTTPDITQTGTGLSDVLTGTNETDVIAGNAGDDTITGAAEGDVLIGDYASENLLEGSEGNQGFGDYAATGNWAVTQLDGGHQSMSQTVQTEIGGVYEMSLELASNFAAGVTSIGVEILVNGVVVQTLTSDSGAFSEHLLQITASGTETEITLRSIDGPDSGPPIDTSGPVYTYETEIDIGGTVVTVPAFAEGQANLYQVLNGTLHVFDTESQTYDLAGSSATVNVNSLGFNVENNMLYAIAVGNGTDSLGNAVSRADLVMIDAHGDTYRVGETPYRSWTGDFDDQGNLWSFQSSMDHIAVIDVDSFDADGNPETTVFKLPKELVNLRVYDVAFDAATQTFSGVARPSAEGENATLLRIDISSGSPVFSTYPVTSTVVDGVTLVGAPAMTFGASIYDGDGNLYVGGNSGDHDMNDGTNSSGGIYRVTFDEDSGTASLELLADAPKSSSNDGAADPRALSPFAEVDLESAVLVRDLSLVATTEGELTYDDSLVGEGGQDTIDGGIGDDVGIGGSLGDTIMGGTGNDELHGGAGPSGNSDIVSTYDDDGLRYDQYGNLLPEDDDYLLGGTGDDVMSGSAGHDSLDGGAGNDVLNGGSGWDNLVGGTGNDTLNGGSDTDTLSGGSGEDVLTGGSGNDVLFGGNDADDLAGGSGDDSLDGGGGADALSGGSGHDELSGDDGEDALDGGSGNDTLDGDAGNDQLKGGSGNDVLSGGADQDDLNGGTGNDVLSGGSENDTLKGGSGSDALNGGDGNDYMNGASGNDTLDGGEGRDRLYLGSGDDVATGGLGADRFVFRSSDLDGGSNAITDFSFDERDWLDLRQLSLDDSEPDLSAWFSDATNQQSNGIALNLSGTTVLFEGLSGNDDLAALYDAILF